MSSLVISGDTSGTVTLAAPAVAGSNTLTLQAGTATNSMNTLATAVASTSGTSIDFTGLPSWIKRITVMFNGVSTSGTSNPLFQLGSGSFTTSGYSGSSQNMFAANTFQINALSSGFMISTGAATDIRTGTQVFTLITGNTWIGVGCFATTTTGSSNYNQGVIALSGALDRVRITTVNGTDTFDAGTINILYEG